MTLPYDLILTLEIFGAGAGMMLALYAIHWLLNRIERRSNRADWTFEEDD